MAQSLVRTLITARWPVKLKDPSSQRCKQPVSTDFCDHSGQFAGASVSEVRKLSILYRFVTAIASISRIDRPQTSRFQVGHGTLLELWTKTFEEVPMPGPHISMRQTREVLRLSLRLGLSLRQVSASVGILTLTPALRGRLRGVRKLRNRCTDSIGTGVRTRSEWVYGNHGAITTGKLRAIS